MVGKRPEMSNAMPCRIATTDGPLASGRQARPASAACSASSGKPAQTRDWNGVMADLRCFAVSLAEPGSKGLDPLRRQGRYNTSVRKDLATDFATARRALYERDRSSGGPRHEASVRRAGNHGRAVSGRAHRGGVAGKARPGAVQRVAQARHGTRRHQPVERGKAARHVRLRRLRQAAVRLRHQVRERHRAGRASSSRWTALSGRRRTAACSWPGRRCIAPIAAGISATCFPTGRARRDCAIA